MNKPFTDIHSVIDAFQEAGEKIIELFEDAGGSVSPNKTPPTALTEALHQLGEVAKRIEQDYANCAVQGGDSTLATSAPLRMRELNELGEYGIRLLDELATHAARLRLPKLAQDVQELIYPFSLWIARRGGEIQTLEPVVNALASIANHSKEPVELEELTVNIREIVEAAAPAIRHDLDNSNPLRPWRILLFNYAIVATRSHQTWLMHQAFDALIHHLPEDAPQFFREGMEQMQAVPYPSHVREVMERYYNDWCTKRTLH